MGRIVAIAWGITLVLAYFALGDVLGRLIEGYRRDAVLFAPAFVTIAALVASLVLTAIWARRADWPRRRPGRVSNRHGQGTRPGNRRRGR